MIRRSKPLVRSRPPKASKRPKAVNPARRKREWALAYHSAERVTWIQGLSCVWCSMLFPFARPWLAGGCQNAHTTGGGMGRKSGYETIAPLCNGHHAAYDAHREPFNDPSVRQCIADAAADTQAQWLAFSGAATGSTINLTQADSALTAGGAATEGETP